MKNFWIAADVEANGKYCAFAFPVSENENLVRRLQFKPGNLYNANIMPSKKAAVDVATAWNDAHKANGNYMFAKS